MKGFKITAFTLISLACCIAFSKAPTITMQPLTKATVEKLLINYTIAPAIATLDPKDRHAYPGTLRLFYNPDGTIAAHWHYQSQAIKNKMGEWFFNKEGKLCEKWSKDLFESYDHCLTFYHYKDSYIATNKDGIIIMLIFSNQFYKGYHLDQRGYLTSQADFKII